jgi:hypothetical protein
MGTSGCKNAFCPSKNGQQPSGLEPTQLDRIEDQNALLLSRHLIITDMLKELLKESKESKAKKKRVVKPKNDFIMIPPEGVDPKVWDDYLKHRKEKGQKVTERAYNMMFKKLMEWGKDGVDLDEVLKSSIQNGYTGIFKPKTNGFEQPLKKEHISSTYKQFDPNKRGDADLIPVDPYADLK